MQRGDGASPSHGYAVVEHDGAVYLAPYRSVRLHGLPSVKLVSILCGEPFEQVVAAVGVVADDAGGGVYQPNGALEKF